jgi:hypothetical protein
MTEALIRKPPTPKTGYRQLFEQISKELPQRGAFSFDAAVSARLRRLDPETEFATPDLVRVLVSAGVATGELRHSERARSWAAVGQSLALMAHAGLRSGPSIGAALRHIELSDNRLARLLTARGAALREQGIRTVRLISSAGNPASLDDLLELMLVDTLPGSDEWAESLRLRIVESFERATPKADASVG